MADRERRVLLVCTPGGHLLQLLILQEAWHDCARLWVTTEAPDVRPLLAGEPLRIVGGPAERSVPRLLVNLVLAYRIMRAFSPDAIVSTGAAVAVPFFVVARLLGVRRIYVESVTRVRELSLTGKLVHVLADDFFVQWPEARRPRRIGPAIRYEGSIL